VNAKEVERGGVSRIEEVDGRKGGRYIRRGGMKIGGVKGLGGRKNVR
jgi:hypothetical protein